MTLAQTMPPRPEPRPRGPSISKRRGRKASTLVRLYQLLKEYPMISNWELAKQLNLSLPAVYNAKTRLKKSINISKYCLDCKVLSLQETLEGLVCKECGRVYPREEVKINPFFRSPVNALHWGHALGSDVDCNELRVNGIIASKPSIIRSQIIDSIDDKAIRDCLEELMRHIRTLNLDLTITDSLGMMLREKIRDFKMKYPLIPITNKVKQSIVLETLASASLDFPRLKEAYRSYLQKITSKDG